jgi:hypothetical protein
MTTWMARSETLRGETLSALLREAREFVRRVEAGEVRSRKTYAAFKEILQAWDDRRIL